MPAPLPPGLRVAGMRDRLGAWLIDTLILGGFQLGFWLFAIAVGAVSINPDAEKQLEAAPLTMPTVAPYQTNPPLLALLLTALVALSVIYATISWARFRGLPGQRLLSLQVGSAATGMNLSLGRALIRAIAALGVPLAAASTLLYAVFAYETSVPWADVLSPQPGGPTEAWISQWSAILFFVVLVAVVWPVLLLTSTASSATRQGLHDRLAGSLVVGKGAAHLAGSAYSADYAPSFGTPPGYAMPGFLAQPGAVQMPGTESGREPGEGPLPGAMPLPGGRPEAGPGFVADQTASTPASGDSEPVPARPAWIHPADDAPPKPFVATVGRRATAYLIDCMIVFTLYSLIGSIVAATLLPAGTTKFDDRTYILFGLAGGFMQLAYFTIGWSVLRGTIVQRMMHLRVADVTTGKPLSWLDAVVRWAILQGPFALFTIVPAGAQALVLPAACLWSAYLFYSTSSDASLRGVHDRFLNSRVVSEP